MERVRTLLEKLKLQSDQDASASAMLHTVQMLQAELIREMGPTSSMIQRKVSVSPPSVFPPQQNSGSSVGTQGTQEDKIVEILQVDEKEVEEELAQMKEHAETLNAMGSHSKPSMYLDPLEDIPTLSHQNPSANPEKRIPQGNLELPDLPESLNDRLKQAKTELSESLNTSPIKDLRKAIPVNDRFIFINELFRGDEAMYERSIKTIQGFSNAAEAEFWIRRELKVKIGWLDNDPVVKQFDELVRRKFL